MKKSKKRNKIFLGLIILIICLSLFELMFFRVDPDYFWHFKAGKYMVEHGFLREDVFSWFMNGKYWMSHEWLFDVLIYGLKAIFGNYHVLVYSFFAISSLLFILLFTNKEGYLKNIPFTLIWYLMFFVMILGYIQARPHLFSFSLLALTIYVLYDLYKDESSRKLYFLPVITIIWANFHGGSSNLPYLFCLLFMVGGLFSFKMKKIEAKRITKKQFFKYGIVMLVCMVCVCINLHGVKMFSYPYLNMLDSTMIGNISEWRSTTLNDIYHYLYFIMLLIVVMVMLFSDKKIEFVDLLLFGVVTYLGLKSIRFWFYTYIVMSYVVFNYLKERKIDKGTFSCLMIFAFMLFLAFIVNLKNIFNVRYEVTIKKDVVKIIKEENPKRLFNMYDYGGELIYNDIKVFIDGRADLYSKYNFKDYLSISMLEKDYVKLIDKYKFDYFLVAKEYPIRTYLKYSDDYEKIFSNKDLELYKTK